MKQQIKRVCKLLGFCFLVVFYFILCVLTNLIFNKHKKLEAIANVTSISSGLMLKLLDISIIIPKSTYIAYRKCLIVSNHVSYLDIIVISSIIPSIFVTSLEVKNQFFTGFLSKLGGSFFVSRKRMQIDRNKNIEIAKVMAHSSPVVLFPEATSSNGEKVLPFKSSLFESIVMLKGFVLPIFLKYSTSSVAYYGDMKFFHHLWNLFKMNNIKVEVNFCEPVIYNQNSTRKIVCQEAYQNILKKMEGNCGSKI
jgi:1-acyl-sn-glycerol-3-phosphate acyltransferase